MSEDRTEGRRANHRALRPTLDNTLEARYLLSTAARIPGAVYLANPKLGLAYKTNNPPHTTSHSPPYKAQQPLSKHESKQTGHGGQKVRIFENGGVWDVTLTEYTPAISPGGTAGEPANGAASTPLYTGPYQSPGTVRAYPLGAGSWGLIVDGTTALSELDINPVAFPQRKGYAHDFAYSYANRPRILNIGAIDVTSGQIGAIEGFHTANLTGPLTVNGTGTVDRIAFNAINPGASITMEGTLNTLDVYNGITLTTGTSINVGRDLNLLNVGQNISLSNGSSIIVGRTLGALPQPAKGTGTGSNILSLNQSLVGTDTTEQLPNVAAYIQGSVAIGAGSSFTVGYAIGQPALTSTATTANSLSNIVIDIQGNLSGASNVHIPNAILAPGVGANVIVNGSVTP